MFVQRRITGSRRCHLELLIVVTKTFNLESLFCYVWPMYKGIDEFIYVPLERVVFLLSCLFLWLMKVNRVSVGRLLSEAGVLSWLLNIVALPILQVKCHHDSRKQKKTKKMVDFIAFFMFMFVLSLGIIPIPFYIWFMIIKSCAIFLSYSPVNTFGLIMWF